MLIILKDQVAASSLVGLLTHSFFNDFDAGSGIISISTLSSGSSGSSCVPPGASDSMRADVGLIWIRGLMLAFSTTISCFGFRFLDSLPNTLHAEASSECATSSKSKSSVIKVQSSVVRSSGSSIALRIPKAEGTSLSGIRHSSFLSRSSVGGGG